MIVGLNLLYLLPGVVGGTETYAAGLVHGLARSPDPDRFVVFVNRESADWPLPDDPRFRRVVCPVHAVSRPARYRYEQFRLPARAMAERVDLVHSLGYVAPLRLRRPSVLTVHDVHHLAYGRLREWPRRLILAQMVRRSVRGAAAVIAVSRYTRDAVARAYDVPASAIDVVWEAPNPRLRSDSPEPGPLPAGVHVGPYLLAFGGITPNKNLERLLRAFAIARSRHGIAHRLVIVGHVAPSLRPEGTEGVVGTGYLGEPELAGLLRSADALVFPSLYEGFGLPILEAMTVGVPVVCSNAAAIPEVAGDAARYFDPRDVEAMAAAIAAVCRDPALRRDLAARGRARAAAFSWERAARETLAIYRRVLAPARASVCPTPP
ncbi:MAG TPA: glycosyltransferase family 1 protein [Gemmatimonadales bacterium]